MTSKSTSRSTAALVTLVAAAQSAGCYSTFEIRREGLTGLHGFGVPVVPEPRIVERPHPSDPTRTIRVVLPPPDPAEKKYWLTTVDGEEIEFDRSSTLRIERRDGSNVSSQFEKIQVEKGVFRGTERQTKAMILVDLPQIWGAQATVRSPGKTALATLGVVTGTVVAGILLLSNVGGPGGRPLRIPGQMHAETAPILMRKKPCSRKRAPRDIMDARAFAHWAQEAAAECASVPAFMALARDLARMSAPTNLVRSALRAAKEEVDHTRLCLGLAERHDDVLLEPIMPTIPEAVDVNASALLERLVLEAFWDGCVAEGSAAALARRNTEWTTDSSTRLAVQTIARDETEHARLAETILAYGLATDRRNIGRALRESFEMRQHDMEKRLDELGAVSATNDADVDVVRETGLARDAMTMAANANVEAWERSVALLSQLGV